MWTMYKELLVADGLSRRDRVLAGYRTHRQIREGVLTMRVFIAALAGALVVVLLPAGSASAADWRVLDTTAERTALIDVGGIRRNDGVVLAWVKFSFLNDQPDPINGLYRSMLQLFAFQCGAGRHALMQFTKYRWTNGEGDVVATWSTGTYDWTYPTPDSIGEMAMKVACQHSVAKPRP
jgi:hypothetical protein